jgi:murein L,D-transpeptidase YcbB/YkuD
MNRLLFIISLLYSLSLHSQITPEQIKQVFSGLPGVTVPQLNNKKLAEQFYQQNDYQLVWMQASDTVLVKDLFRLFSSSVDFGLDERDYQFSLVQSLHSHDLFFSALDSIFADIQLTDAALEFLSDLRNGNKPPQLRYEGLKYQRIDIPLMILLSNYCSRHHLNGITAEAEPPDMAYMNAKKMLAHFNVVMDETNFREVRITSNLVSNTNIPLVAKLYQLGIIDSTSIPEGTYLRKKLQEAQIMLNVLNDGALRSPTLAALNIPLWARREEIKILMNHIRYVCSLKTQGKLAVVNIPSTTLYVYGNDTIILNSKIIAGKLSTPTPTLSSSITEVIVYPYWYVPHKIATRELLPVFKNNVGSIEENNYQILDKNGKILNPYKINWNSLSTTNFPYTVRQSTGCDNSLGLLKFNFYNPFTVYLHDTPGKGLFYLTKRFFSHGCMRVEKPVELSQLLLGEKASSIENLISQCLRDQKPKSILLEEPLPLIVLYGTAWYNEKGGIQFFEDVYHQLNLSRNAIAENNN